jgi:dienelactone hydrolase
MNFEATAMKWAFWPEREDLSLEFMRLLAAAQEGGSTIAECLLAASRIEIDDDNSWYSEWTRTADTNHERGNAALGSGNLPTAKANWLRAINYYQAAAVPFECSDNRQQAGLASMRECARKYLLHRKPIGEVVGIPWLSDYPLQGYFLPPGSASDRTPAVICVGEPGHRKEEYLFKLARHAHERGISLLAVDLLGEGLGTQLEKVIGRRDLESAVRHVMDYLAARDDVDENRIAILADGWGSSFVARGIAFDARLAAAVCDGGIWDLHEQTFLANRLASRDANIDPVVDPGRIMRGIECPVLITVGEHGWLEAERVMDMFSQLKMDRADVTLKIFTGAETAAAQGHADNPTLANEFVFDWIASQLGIDAAEEA